MVRRGARAGAGAARPRLVATDVDGTLLDAEERVSSRAAAVIHRLVAAGVLFVIVTGRAPRWIQPVVAQLGAARLALCANGGVLYDAVDDRVLTAHTMGPQLLSDIAALARDRLPGCVFAVERVGEDAADGPFAAEPGYHRGTGHPDHVPLSRREVLSRPAVKLLVRDRRLPSDFMLDALAATMDGVANLTFARPQGLVEISAPGVTKAMGLAAIAHRHRVPACRAVVFGDMPNDLSMIRWAGCGVAVANAHPLVLNAADEVTAANTDDGVAALLERWF